MAVLRKVLAALLADVVHARVAADEATSEAVRLYQSDPILRQLPVPKLSIQTIELMLPFAIDAAAERPERPTDGLSDVLRELVVAAFSKLGSLSVRPRPRGRPTTLSAVLDDRAEAMKGALGEEAREFGRQNAQLFADDAERFARGLADALRSRIEAVSSAVVTPNGREELGELMMEFIQNAARRLSAHPAGLDLDVKVTAHELAEVSDPSRGKIALTLSLTDVDAISREEGDDIVLAPR